MTREFNNQRRNDSRPPFRNSSPNRNRDEQSPRPARPRLNRETVDRAWESGAQQRHADYRPRSGNGQNRPQGQQRNTGWRNNSNNQQSDYSSQNSRGGNRPYGNRQDNYNGNRPYGNRQDSYRDSHQGNYREDRRENQRGFERTPNNTQGPRPFGQDRRKVGDQRFNDRRDSFNGQGRTGNRPQFQNRGNQRRDFGRDDRSPGNFHSDRSQPNTSNPRWQTRPTARRDYAPREEQQEFSRRPRNEELFEGDYERFENSDSRPARSSERPFRGSRDNQGRQGSRDRRDDERESQPQERHVTRLPDGRVLKGPRPAQRKNAQFWTGVAEDTSEILSRVSVNEAPIEDQENAPVTNEEVGTTGTKELTGIDEVMGEETKADAPQSEIGTSEEASPKRRTRTASGVARTKKTVKSGPTTLKPSRRGFKWPTQQ